MSKAKSIAENNEYVITFSIMRKVSCCTIFQEYTENLGICPLHVKLSFCYVKKMYEATRMTVPLVLLIYFYFLINLAYAFKGKLVPILFNCGCLLISLHKDFKQGCLLSMAMKIYWVEF